MTIRVLGAIGAVHQGELIRLTRAARHIFAVLVAAGPDGLSADRLADEIWGDEIRPNWDDNLRMAISRTRRAIPLNAIATGGRHYALTLPTDEVDVWQLLDTDAIDLAAIDEARLLSLVGDESYPEPIESRLVSESRNRIDTARATLLDRIRREAPERASGALLRVSGHHTRTSLDERLIVAALQLHASVGRRADVTRLANDAACRLEREIGASVSHELAALTEPGQSSRETIDRAPARVIGTTFEVDPKMHQRSTLCTDIIAKLDTGSALVEGEPGAGKTELARSIARQRHTTGNHVLWLVGNRDAAAAFGPIAACFPEVIARLDALDVDGETRHREAREWGELWAMLRRAFPDRPLTIVVDDAQWIDSHTTRFLEASVRSSPAQDHEVLIVGRHDATAPAWGDVADRLRRAGVGSITVGPFDESELLDLIGRAHPQSTSLQRVELARLLVAERAALPIVAVELIGAADKATLTPPAIEAGAGHLADQFWTSLVAERSRQVGAAAALLGLTWRFSDALELTDLDSHALADAIGELLDTGLVEGEARPDTFRFRHVLVQEAFAALVGGAARRRMHRAAARSAALDGRVHAHARHLRAAGPGVSPDALAAVLLASAEAHLEAGSFLEAVHSFASADAIDDRRLDAPTLARYTLAIERSGGDGTAIRHRAFAAAEDLDDAALMLSVVLAGVDPGELLEADEARLSLLERVPREQLEPSARLRLDATRCRELGLAGRHAEALEIHASMSADTADERTTRWLGIWTSLMCTPPPTWPDIDIDPLDVTDRVERARLRNTQCERLLLLGDRRTFAAELAALEREPASEDHPRRRWQLRLLQALDAHVRGDLSESNRIADEGLADALPHGIIGALPARSAQVFGDHWVRGRHGDLLALLEGAAPDLADSLMATAALASALVADPDRSAEGIALSRHVTDRLDETTRAVHAPIAVLFAEFASRLEPTARERLEAILRPHLGGAVLVGAGVAHLGPASRALARLAPTPAEAHALLHRSIEEADRWSLPLWSVRCRLEAAHSLDAPSLRAEAAESCAGTELAATFGLA